MAIFSNGMCGESCQLRDRAIRALEPPTSPFTSSTTAPDLAASAASPGFEPRQPNSRQVVRWSERAIQILPDRTGGVVSDPVRPGDQVATLPGRALHVLDSRLGRRQPEEVSPD
jgi:hypothetical protein